MKLKTDINNNGLKILRVTIPGKIGFSVQTNGNLPQTHRMPADHPTFDLVAGLELLAYVRAVGTDRQKRLLGV